MMRWAGHVAGRDKNARKILVGNQKGDNRWETNEQTWR